MIELTDPNGVQLGTGCNQPGGSTTKFSSACLNDDISASPHVQDSALDYKVPGTSGTQAFLVHVLDWSGNARPDMIYSLQISGVLDPVVIQSTTVPNGGVNVPYSQPITALNTFGTANWAVSSGSLPTGLSLSSGGILSGTPSLCGGDISL